MDGLRFLAEAGQWLLILCLTLAVAALTRQIGLLHRRVAPTGARMDANGPPLGELAPALDTIDVFGRRTTLAADRGKQTLLIFLAPRCPVCSELMPAILTIARAERARAEVILVSMDGDEITNKNYAARQQLGDLRYVLSPELAQRYMVTGAPHAVLIGADGRVLTKGVVNHLEHIESLFTSAALDAGTTQSAGSPGEQVTSHAMVTQG